MPPDPGVQRDAPTGKPAARPERSLVPAVVGLAVRKFRQFRISTGQRGIRTTLFWAAYGFVRPNRFSVFARDVRGTKPAPPATPGVTYAMWDASGVTRWRAGRTGLPPELFQDAIDGVSLCTVALVGGEIAGFIWVYRTGDASRLFDLGPAEAELNHGAVLEPYRKMGLFRGVLTFASAWLGEHGHDTVYSNVHSRNTPSLKAFRGAGFQEIGSTLHVGPFRPKFPTRAAA